MGGRLWCRSGLVGVIGRSRWWCSVLYHGKTCGRRLWRPGWSEAFGELRLVFAGFEEAFREGIVIGCVGPAMGLGDAQVGEQQGGGFGFHGGSAVGVQGELAGQTRAWRRRLKQRFEQGGVFGVGDEPTHDPSAEDVDDRVEIEVGHLAGPSAWLCPMTRPGWGLGDEFRLFVDGVAQLWRRSFTSPFSWRIRYMVRIEQ